MSNLDPFTQKLLLRTQARKEARLKRQISAGLPAQNDSTPLSSTVSIDKKFESSAQPRIPLAEKNEIDQIESDSPTGRSNKKRQSSEDLNCSLEKRLKPNNSALSTVIGQEKSPEKKVVVLTTGIKSPIQRITVKASIQESPKHNIKSSLASRLNRLNQQYTEQFQIDIEEENRRKEAESVWEVRRKEHLKQQEEERAQVIQERIFGKDYVKQREEEKINKLREKYLGDTPRNSSATSLLNIKKTEGAKQACPKSDSSLKPPLRNQKEEITLVNVKGSISDSAFENHDVKGISGSIQEKNKMEINGEDIKLSGGKQITNKPVITPKPAVKSQKPATAAKGSQKRNSVYDGDSEHTSGASVLKRTEDERMRCGSVRDKKSIFEEKMKQEREARSKEKEADEWLQMKSCRRSADISNAAPCNSNEELNNADRETSKNKVKSSLDPVAELCNGEMGIQSKSIPVPSIVSKPSENIVLTEKDTEPKKNITSSKSSMEDMKGDADVVTKILPESLNNMPVDPVLSSPENMIESPVKNYTGDVHSPQPVDCTEDTIFSDTQAFDVSSILRIAAHREEAQSHLKSARGHPNRCSTMKVEPAHLAMAENLPELNMTPINNDSDDDEVLSEFAKAIKNRVKSIKGPDQKQRLEAIDIKTRPLNDAETKPLIVDDKVKHVSKGSEKRPAKPPRSNKNIVKTESSESNDVESHNADTPTEKARLKPIKEKHYSAGCKDDVANIILKPTEKYSRKKMRRSNSFSEGQVTTPVKSGYHRELSERYDACASFDKPDIVNSKKDKIQSLLEEAACQQNIVLQASQALNVAECSNEDKSNSPEVIEGERLLLLATERRTVCLEEVKVLKENDFDPYLLKDRECIPPCKATLALTDIKLPLHRDFVNSLKARKLDIGMFHFVVIISAGNKNIYSTKVVSCYDDMEDCALEMKSNILMKNIPHDFTLTMKVFGMHSGRNNDQITKIKKNNANSQSSPGNLKNLFSKRNKEDEYTYYASPQTVFRTSNFKLVGESKVNLSLLGNGVTKYALTKVPSNCPVEGCIQLRANCKPEYSANVSGFLTILEDVGGYTAWNRRWCNMKDSRVLYWRYPDDEKDKEPMGNIDLRYCADKVVKLLARDICARPHTFELTLKRASLPTDTANLITTIDGKVTKIKHWVCCDNKDDRVTWMDTINKQLSDSRAWRLKKILKSPTSQV